jgi:hypothetical protein
MVSLGNLQGRVHPFRAPGCAELKLQEQPNWPYGIEVTNQDVLLAEAGALHNTPTPHQPNPPTRWRLPASFLRLTLS